MAESAPQVPSEDSTELLTSSGALPRVWLWIEQVSGIRHELSVSDRLGRGSYGLCHTVVDSISGELFCIKTPTTRGIVHDAQKALRQEFRRLYHLHHPNVVRPLALIKTSDDLANALLLPL